MAVYEGDATVVKLKELHKYGSSRIGMLTIEPNQPIQSTTAMMGTSNNNLEAIGKTIIFIHENRKLVFVCS